MEHFWRAALAVCGLSAIAAFVFWSLYSSLISRNGILSQVVSQVSPTQTFILMLVFLGLTFLSLISMLAVYLLQGENSRVRLTGRKQNEYEPDGKFDAYLYFVLGNSTVGPVKTGVYAHQKPSLLEMRTTDDAFQLPETMRSPAKRRVYWREGHKFLNDDIDFRKQGIHAGHTLLVTDMTDPMLLAPISDVLGGQVSRSDVKRAEA